MAAHESLDGLLRVAIVDGSDPSFEAYGRVGALAVHHFRDYMAGARDIQLPDAPDPRGQLDNTRSVSCWLAGRCPEEYLAIFNSTQWLEHDEIVMGLGYTRLPAAKRTLIAVLAGNQGAWVRLSAARTLRHLPGGDTVRALLGAIDDPEYLVQYQAIESLGIVGDRAALDRLKSLIGSSNRGIALAAADSVKRLAERFGSDEGRAPSKGSARWRARWRRRASRTR